MRYRQILNKETNRYELIPIGSERSSSVAPAIHGDIESFRSIVDGTVISDRKQLREHNKRNGVVNTADLQGQRPAERSTGWSRESKMDIYERINRLEGQS